MAVKRLNIEIPWEQYEVLRREAAVRGTTLSGVLRDLIAGLKEGPAGRRGRASRTDPFLSRKGSFEGPPDLAEKHDEYLYGKRR
jgi:hypothetical protein